MSSSPTLDLQPEVGTLTAEDIRILSQPFPREAVGVLVISTNKDKTRAQLVQYLQHTDVYQRVEEVDRNWSFKVLSEQFIGTTCSVRGRMTVKGTSRENYGEGGDPKSAASDCLKRCAMLFGVGRYLYDAPRVWVDYDERNDKYREWTMADYEAGLKRVTARLEPSSEPAPRPTPSRQPSPIRLVETPTPAAPARPGWGSRPEDWGRPGPGADRASAPGPRPTSPPAPGPAPSRELGRIVTDILLVAKRRGITEADVLARIRSGFRKELRQLTPLEAENFLAQLNKEPGRNPR